MALDYLAVGNPTIDRRPDGDAVIGGTVVYAAVQAQRLGWNARVIGRANVEELRPFLPVDEHITWDLQSAPASTTFSNTTEDDERVQRIHATAGRVAIGPEPLEADVVHLAPVCAELDLRDACLLAADAAFVGATPQGAFRVWGDDEVVGLRPVKYGNAVCRRLDAVVVGHNEAHVADALMRGVSAAGGLAVLTRGDQGCEVWCREYHEVFPATVTVDEVDATGAGDVFAAALFTQLASGESPADAIAFAQAAAACSVRGVAVSAISDAATIAALRDGV